VVGGYGITVYRLAPLSNHARLLKQLLIIILRLSILQQHILDIYDGRGHVC